MFARVRNSWLNTTIWWSSFWQSDVHFLPGHDWTPGAILASNIDIVRFWLGHAIAMASNHDDNTVQLSPHHSATDFDNSENDSDSDVLMATAIWISSDSETDQEGPYKRRRLVKDDPINLQDSDDAAAEFEFESVVHTDTDDDEQQATPTMGGPLSTDRPSLRRLGAMQTTTGGDESDDAASNYLDCQAGVFVNPQDSYCEPSRLAELPANDNDDMDSNQDYDNDNGMDSDHFGNGNGDSDSTQSWEQPWRQNPVTTNNGGLWSLSLPPPFPPAPGSDPNPNPVPLVDPQVICVTFEHRMRVEMRFPPGLRNGFPQTRILSSHWSHVGTNFWISCVDLWIPGFLWLRYWLRCTGKCWQRAVRSLKPLTLTMSSLPMFWFVLNSGKLLLSASPIINIHFDSHW